MQSSRYQRLMLALLASQTKKHQRNRDCVGAHAETAASGLAGSSSCYSMNQQEVSLLGHSVILPLKYELMLFSIPGENVLIGRQVPS